MARPRGFDREEALKRAMETFWEHGYDGSSLAALTAAMGVNRPSLYAAFGSKEALFKEALDHYWATAGSAGPRAVAEAPTARASVEGMLRADVALGAAPGEALGCMVVLACTVSSQDSKDVRDHLAQSRRDSEAALRQRIARGVAEGDVPKTADPAELAAFYTTVQHGLSIQARDGASRETLNGVVDCAMVAWDWLAEGATRHRWKAQEPLRIFRRKKRRDAETM